MSVPSAPQSVLIVAAEESSCKYALRLIKHLQNKTQAPITYWGIGNQEMCEHGFKAIVNSEDIAVMGLIEVFKIQAKIRQSLKDILNRVEQSPPQVAVLLDFGGFNLYLAKELKKRNIPVVYYVLPKVWAWRKKRALKIKNYVDQALAIHPFEVDFFKALGVEASFVGHPLLEEKQDFLNSGFDQKQFKIKCGLNSEKEVVGLMPGSRRSELKKHLNPMLDAAQKTLENFPDTQVAVLVAPAFEVVDLKAMIQKKYKFPVHFIKAQSWQMVQACDYMITASGTATLQVGLLYKPQVVIYKMNTVSAWLARKVVKVPYFSLVNLILEKPAVTELFQTDANPQKISEVMLQLMNKTEAYQAMKKAYALLEEKMQSQNATEEVVRRILPYLKTDLIKETAND